MDFSAAACRPEPQVADMTVADGLKSVPECPELAEEKGLLLEVALGDC